MMLAILLVCVLLLIPPSLACLGGGGQACCPVAATSCAPALPRCPSSYGSGIGSSCGAGGGGCASGVGAIGPVGGPVSGIAGPIGGIGGGGSYAAPPIGPSYGAGSAPVFSNIASAPSYSNFAPAGPGYTESRTSGSYSSGAGIGTGIGNGIGYSESGPGLANGPPPNVGELPVGAPSQSSYNDNSAPLPAPAPAPGPAPAPPPAPAPLPAPAEGGEYQQSSSDNAYEEISGDHDKSPDTEASIGTYEENGGSASASGPAPAPLPAPNSESANVYEQSAGAEAVGSENNYEETNVAPALPPASQANEYADETNAAVEPVNVDAEGAACEDPELKAIVENALNSESDNLEAARKIEGNASKKFGGRFNSIVSDSEFAYVNWYGKRNCQLRVRNRHSLTWED